MLNDKNLPILIAKLDDFDLEKGVQIVSLVEDPAIEVDFIALSKKMQIKMQNEAQKIVTGPLLIPNQKIYRFSEQHGAYYIQFDAETIKKTAQKFLREKNIDKTNLEHSTNLDGNYVFESWVVQNEGETRGFDVPVGTWMISMKLSDESWEMVKSGEVRGFSVEGFFDFEQKLHSHSHCCALSAEDVAKSKLLNYIAKQGILEMSNEEIIALRNIRLERWITSGDESVCPICTELEEMGWVIRGTLPRYRKAHSTIGQGRWKASDSACRCNKETKSVDSSDTNAVRKFLGR